MARYDERASALFEPEPTQWGLRGDERPCLTAVLALRRPSPAAFAASSRTPRRESKQALAGFAENTTRHDDTR
jgi:hypothetical protein